MKAFYDGWIQQPVLVGAPSVLFLAYLLFSGISRRGWYWRYLVLFTTVSMLDAVLTSNRWGVGGPRFGWMVATFFVWIGDLKAYAFVAHERRLRPRTALAWSAIVPIASAGFVRLGYSGRELFLAYELLFLGVWTAFTLRHRVPARLASLTYAYYSLWALADIWILSQGESHATPWVLRIGANLLYYAAWTPWVYLTAVRGRQPEGRLTTAANGDYRDYGSGP